MKCLIYILLLLAAVLPAQEPVPNTLEKGAAPVNPQSVNPQSVIRAVVVGISDYQDNGIPDLQYAHRDAEAFAAWLRSPAGGNMPERNLVLLTNGEATLGKIVSALTGLIADAREGDQVIIYFSGHGDVEANLFSQPGYLLCHDSKASVYMAGAFNIRDLQEVVNTLSLQNKARVLVITDACRAGKLAGSSINGAQLTSANLAKQFTNETKILSCQTSEYSLEGPQWGGGRGVFSYHLVDGLTGLADRNADDLVTLFELEMYLGEKVPEETAPHRQFPFAIGDKTAKMARVDAPALAALRQAKSGASPMLGGTDMRGWEDELVATTDSATQALYYAYKSALKHGALIDTAGGNQSAWALLPQLLQRESLSELHGLLRRNLAAALLDEAQQALNALLDDDPYETNQWLHNPDKYVLYPEYLAKTIELLGERHYMYNTLMGKQLFFQAKNVAGQEAHWQDGGVWNDSINQLTRNLLTSALKLEPNAPYAHYALGTSWMKHYWGDGADTFFYHQNQALALSPTWVMPRLNIVNFYMFNIINPDWKTCEEYILQGLALKPNSYVLTERLAWLYQRTYRMDEAIALAHKMASMRPDLPNGYATLGSTYSSLRQYDLAEDFAQKALSVDSTVWRWPMGILATTASRKRLYEKSFGIARKLINGYNTDWHFSNVFERLKMRHLQAACLEYFWKKDPQESPMEKAYDFWYQGTINFYQKRWPEAKGLYLESIKEQVKVDTTPDPSFIVTFNQLAQIYAHEAQPDSAEYYFQKAINYYYPRLLGSWGFKEQFAEARYHYARFLLTQNRLPEAEAQLKKAEEIDPRNPENYYGMAALHAAQKHDKEALDWLAKALEWYYPDYDEIMAEPLFKKIRKTKRFKALMQQYFPDGSDRPKVEALARKYLPEVFEE